MSKTPTEKQLLSRLARAEEALYKEQLKNHKVFENMGWGAGMRRVKLYPAYTRQNELEERIKQYKAQLADIRK